MGYFNVEENVLKFDLTGDEIRKHCQDRSEFHKARRDFFEKRERDFSDEAEEFKATSVNVAAYMSGSISTNTIESNKQQMANQKKNHAEKRIFFSFCATHLKQETYALTEQQLQRLEMVY